MSEISASADAFLSDLLTNDGSLFHYNASSHRNNMLSKYLDYRGGTCTDDSVKEFNDKISKTNRKRALVRRFARRLARNPDKHAFQSPQNSDMLAYMDPGSDMEDEEDGKQGTLLDNEKLYSDKPIQELGPDPVLVQDESALFIPPLYYSCENMGGQESNIKQSDSFCSCYEQVLKDPERVVSARGRRRAIQLDSVYTHVPKYAPQQLDEMEAIGSKNRQILALLDKGYDYAQISSVYENFDLAFGSFVCSASCCENVGYIQCDKTSCSSPHPLLCANRWFMSSTTSKKEKEDIFDISNLCGLANTDTDVRFTRNRGFGLFARSDILPGTYIGQYTGESITSQEVQLRKSIELVKQHVYERHKYVLHMLETALSHVEVVNRLEDQKPCYSDDISSLLGFVSLMEFCKVDHVGNVLYYDNEIPFKSDMSFIVDKRHILKYNDDQIIWNLPHLDSQLDAVLPEVQQSSMPEYSLYVSRKSEREGGKVFDSPTIPAIAGTVFVQDGQYHCLDSKVAVLLFWRQQLRNLGFRAHTHYFFELSSNCTLDACCTGSTMRFINHGCVSNVNAVKIRHEGAIKIGIFASHTIQSGEEILLDYAYDSNMQFRHMHACSCGSRACPGVIMRNERFKHIIGGLFEHGQRDLKYVEEIHSVYLANEAISKQSTEDLCQYLLNCQTATDLSSYRLWVLQLRNSVSFKQQTAELLFKYWTDPRQVITTSVQKRLTSLYARCDVELADDSNQDNVRSLYMGSDWFLECINLLPQIHMAPASILAWKQRQFDWFIALHLIPRITTLYARTLYEQSTPSIGSPVQVRTTEHGAVCIWNRATIHGLSRYAIVKHPGEAGDMRIAREIDAKIVQGMSHIQYSDPDNLQVNVLHSHDNVLSNACVRVYSTTPLYECSTLCTLPMYVSVPCLQLMLWKFGQGYDQIFFKNPDQCSVALQCCDDLQQDVWHEHMVLPEDMDAYIVDNLSILQRELDCNGNSIAPSEQYAMKLQCLSQQYDLPQYIHSIYTNVHLRAILTRWAERPLEVNNQQQFNPRDMHLYSRPPVSQKRRQSE